MMMMMMVMMMMMMMFRDSLSNQAHYSLVRCSNLASDGGLGVFPCSGEGDLCSNGEVTYIGDVEAARKKKDKAKQTLACGQKRISGRRFSPCTRKVA